MDALAKAEGLQIGEDHHHDSRDDNRAEDRAPVGLLLEGVDPDASLVFPFGHKMSPFMPLGLKKACREGHAADNQQRAE